MPAMMVSGAMPLRQLVESACQQGARYSEGSEIHGERPLFLERNGVRATIYTSDLDVVVGPDIVEYVETVLNIVIDDF